MTAPGEDFDDLIALGPEPGHRNRWAIYASAVAVVAIAAAAVAFAATRSSGTHRAANSHPAGVAETSANSGVGVAVGPADVASDVSAAPTESSPGPTDAASAANLWSGFPVDKTPRPIVLIGEDTEGPDGGFTSGDAKLAFGSAPLRWDIPAPGGPATSGGYPVISAQDAVDHLVNPAATQPQASTTLGIVEAGFTTHAFLTDRGMQSLPAWRFRVTQSNGDVYVLAVAPSARFDRSGLTGSYGEQRAVLSADGRGVTIRFVARHDSTDPCDPPYTSSVDVVQTRTAVAIFVATHDLPVATSTDGAVACAAVGIADTAPIVAGAPDTRTIQLDAPLGARVVVTAYGSPYQVSQA